MEADTTAWVKLGLCAVAAGTGLWQSHAMLPTPLLMEDRIRVFCAGCDAEFRGRVFYVDLDLEPPYRIVSRSNCAVFDVGPLGSFDADGVNPSCLVRRDGVLHLYYIGWRRRPSDQPYTLVSGLAVSEDDGLSFRRVRAPLLDTSGAEPLFRTAPYVWHDGDTWRMLYIGGGAFFEGPGGKRLPIYSLREMSSSDGLSWPDQGCEILRPDLQGGEIGFGRPVLWENLDGTSRVLFSIRTVRGYRLVEAPWPLPPGGAKGFEDAIPPSREGWDSEMICFGAPLRAPREELLFFNGNGFGRTGFGLATRPRPVLREPVPKA